MKTVYANLASYTVRDPKGVPNEQIALSADRDLLTGSKLNEFGAPALAQANVGFVLELQGNWPTETAADS